MLKHYASNAPQPLTALGAYFYPIFWGRQISVGQKLAILEEGLKQEDDPQNKIDMYLFQEGEIST